MHEVDVEVLQRKGTCSVAHGTILSHSRAGEEGWDRSGYQKKSVKGRQTDDLKYHTIGARAMA